MKYTKLIEGEKLIIAALPSAKRTLEAVRKRFGDDKRFGKVVVGLNEWLTELANTLELPDTKFHVRCTKQNDGIQIYGISEQRLRAYGWYSKIIPKTFIISHYTYKDTEETKKEDCDKARKNFKEFEKEARK